MKQETVPKILARLADALGATLSANRLNIPDKYGSGYCRGFVFNDQLRMLISNYTLKEDLSISNPEANTAMRMIFFKFQNIFPNIKGGELPQPPSVLIATSRLNTDEAITIHSNTATVNIEIDAQYLGDLFRSSKKSTLLESLLQNRQPLLFEQVIYPSLQSIVNEMLNEPVAESFQLFFMRVKAEELVCRLLMELDKRDEANIYPLNSKDIEGIYKVRNDMLSQLNIPPQINKLAASAGMSPTKLKRIFKQIFGDSIFSYYQNARIKEAARLLTQTNITVAAAGYQLGFTNLSHFSRVFQEHMGMKPKQYSKLGSV